MVKLHVFNPEHDIALAYGCSHFTAPRAGRQLRSDCSFLPVLWAEEGDYVLVDNVDEAYEKSCNLAGMAGDVRFVTLKELRSLGQGYSIEPWGWDCAIASQLRHAGVDESLLPSAAQLDNVRKLSNRRFSCDVLKEIRSSEALKSLRLVGESEYVTSAGELERIIKNRPAVVLKAPWSSSGRGVRRVESAMDVSVGNWARRIISAQGGIMVEPFYNKLADFGMEFVSQDDGVHYLGLSLFKSVNGFYMGNKIASEEEKSARLVSLLACDSHITPVTGESIALFRHVAENILSEHLRGKYIGPLGIDMMIVDTGKGLGIHPMVEINMRRTMGHVSIAIARRMPSKRFFRIAFDGSHYQVVVE